MRLCDHHGVEFARGLVGFTSDEVAAIMGKSTSEAERLIGYDGRRFVVERRLTVVLLRGPTASPPASSVADRKGGVSSRAARAAEEGVAAASDAADGKK